MVTRSKEFELASAYVSVIPSFAGLSDRLSKEFRKAIPALNELGDKLGTSFTSGIGEKLAAEIAKAAGGAAPLTKALEQAVAGLGEEIAQETQSAIPATVEFGDALKKSIMGTDKILKGIFKGASVLTAPLRKAMMATFDGLGKGLSDTISIAAKGATTVAAGGLGAIGGQIVGGGLNRALSLNASSAKLQALGYQGAQFEEIMKNALDSVNGTAYGMDAAVGAAGGLLAAGIKPGEELNKVLKNSVKLADMSQRPLADIGVMMGKNAASGVVQMDDLNQMIDAGIPILAGLSKQLGHSVKDIKKMASEGKISFNDLNDTISSMEFDSKLLGTKDIKIAFGNLRTSLSKVGATLWTPILDGLLPIIIKARIFVEEFTKQFNFTPIKTKIADFIAKINDLFKNVTDAQGNIDGGKVKQFIDDLTAKYDKFKNAIKGFEGPILGLLAGMSGSLLAGIPIIGPAFAGITPLVGLFAGSLIQAYKHSENLRNTIKSLGDWIVGLGTAIATVFTGSDDKDPMKTFGDKLAAGIESVKKIISDIIGEIVKRGDEIRAAFDDVWQAITGAIGQGGDISGTAIGANIVDFITTFAGYVATIVPIVAGLAKTIANILTSDFMKGFFSWLADIASAISGNEGLIMGIGVTLGALFIGGKLTKPLLAFVGFLGKLKAPKNVEKVGETFGKAVEGFISGLAGVFKVVASNILWILAGIGAFALILAAFAGIGWLANLPGVKDALRGFGDVVIEIGRWVAGIVSQLVTAIMPGVDKIIGLVTTIVDKLAGIWQTFAGAFEFKADFKFNTADLAPIIDSLKGFFGMLADKGVDAGVGALAAAAGISALMFAIGQGSVVGGAGALMGAIFSTIAGQQSPLEAMLQAVERLAAVNAVVLSMPIVWADVLDRALGFGLAIPEAIAIGMMANGSKMKDTLISQIDTMLTEAQTKLDANPLVIKTRMDHPSNALDALNAGSYSSSNTYNTNKSMTINAQGSNFLDTLIRAGR